MFKSFLRVRNLANLTFHEFLAPVVDINDINELANKIEKFLEDFKIKMKNGDESLGIPVLDPLNVKYFPINITEKQLKCVLFFLFLFLNYIVVKKEII